jgi:hypothetical protein
MQNDIGKSIQDYVDQIGNSAAGGMTRGADTAQRVADGALNPMTGMLSVWESAFREVAALANRNMQAARSSFENAAGAATSAATQAVNSVTGAVEEETATHRRSTSGSKRK